MGTAKVQKLICDALKTLPTLSETFDGYTTGQVPPDPWVVEVSGTPMAYVRVDDTVWWDPWTAMPGKSCKLHSEGLSQWARTKAPIKAANTVLIRVALRFSGATGSHAKWFRLFNNSTGNTILQIDYHTDGHLWTYNGATPVDLGALALNTWMDFAIWVNVTAKTFVLYVHHTRWPAGAGTYSFVNAEVPTHIEAQNYLTGQDMWVDFVDDWSDWQYYDFDGDTPGSPPPTPPWTVVTTGPGTPTVISTNAKVNTGRWWSPAGVLSCKFHVGNVADVAEIKQDITLGDYNAFNFFIYGDTVEGGYSQYFELRNKAFGQVCLGIYQHTDGHVYAKTSTGYIDIGPIPYSQWTEYTVFIRKTDKKFYIIRERETEPHRYPATAGTYYDFAAAYDVEEEAWGMRNSQACDFYLDDIWWSYDSWFEDFDDDTTGSPPTDPPWTSDTTAPPSALVVDTPHQGASGKALALWPGPDLSGGYARAYRPIRNFRQVFEVDTYILFTANVASGAKRYLSLNDSYTGEDVVKVRDRTDGKVEFSNGAAWVTGPSIIIDTWYRALFHVDLIKRTYYITFGTTRYPTTGSYALTGTQEPNNLRVETLQTDNGIDLDTILVTFNYLLKDLEVSPIYPRKPITNKPFITTNLGSMTSRWAWAGRDANGRRCLLHEVDMQVNAWVPRAMASGNLTESESDTELLDNVIDAIASTLIDQRLTIPNISKLITGSPSRPAIERDGKLLYRALPVRFQNWEVY
jgi:hypothetical protein